MATSRTMQQVVAFVVLLFAAGVWPSSALGAGNQFIAYVKPGPLIATSRNLWLISPDGMADYFLPAGCTDPQLQCPFLSAEYPGWSRDSGHLAFTGLLGAAAGGGYVVVDWQLSTSQLIVLAPLGTAGGGLPLAFSPDAAFLAYEDFGGLSTDIKIVDIQKSLAEGPAACALDPTCVIDVTPGLGLPGPVQGLDWSPVQNVLVVPGAAFSVSGNQQLFLVPPIFNGIAQAVPLTNPPDVLGFLINDVFPAFSRDGAVVAYARQITNVASGQHSTELRAVGIGFDVPLLQLQNEIITGISWSPDSTPSLVFDVGDWPPGSIYDQGSRGLWILDLRDGVVQVQQARSCCPSWGSPAFSSVGALTPELHPHP